MAAIDDLIRSRDQIAANLAAVSASPKPSYSIDGEAVDWNTWANSQHDQIVKLNQTIQALQPFEVRTRLSL